MHYFNESFLTHNINKYTLRIAHQLNRTFHRMYYSTCITAWCQTFIHQIKCSINQFAKSCLSHIRSLIHTHTRMHAPTHTRTHAATHECTHTRARTHAPTHACTHTLTHTTPQHTHRTTTHTTTRTPLRHLSISPPDPHGVHPPGQWMLNNPTNYSTVYLVQMSNLQRNRQTSRMIVGPGSLTDLVKECKAVCMHTTQKAKSSATVYTITPT